MKKIWGYILLILIIVSIIFGIYTTSKTGKNPESFSYIKHEILTNLEAEKKYVTHSGAFNQIETSISLLRSISDEEIFFETLDQEYMKIDEQNGQLPSFSITQSDKEFLLQTVESELPTISNSQVKEIFSEGIIKLNQTLKTDDFFLNFEEVYDNPIVVEYYQNEKNNSDFEQKIELYMFEKMKILILSEMKTVITAGEYTKLENENNPDNFYNQLYDLYEVYDTDFLE